MADNIWHESGAKIIKLFEDEGELLRDYSFVITGHSLGGKIVSTDVNAGDL
jgi:hypothetical protein